MKLVIFDLDGTLVDSLPDITGALNHALALAGLPALDASEVAPLVGDGVMALARRALARVSRPDAIAPAALAELIVAHYRSSPRGKTRPFADMDVVLEGVARAGAQLAIVTNKTGDVARALVGALGWGARFAAVFGDGDGHPRKPSPALGRVLLDRLAVMPAETLMVGDGLADLAFARALGCRVAAAAWGYTARAQLEAQSPDHVLASPLDLLPLLSPTRQGGRRDGSLQDPDGVAARLSDPAA